MFRWVFILSTRPHNKLSFFKRIFLFMTNKLKGNQLNGELTKKSQLHSLLVRIIFRLLQELYKITGLAGFFLIFKTP